MTDQDMLRGFFVIGDFNRDSAVELLDGVSTVSSVERNGAHFTMIHTSTGRTIGMPGYSVSVQRYHLC